MVVLTGFSHFSTVGYGCNNVILLRDLAYIEDYYEDYELVDVRLRMREKTKKKQACYTIVVETPDCWRVNAPVDASVSSRLFTVIASAQYSQSGHKFLKRDSALYQPFMSAPDVFDRLIDVGEHYAFLGDYTVVTEQGPVSLADMPESLVAPNVFFAVHHDAACLDVYQTSADFRQGRALYTTYRSLYYDHSYFSAAYAPILTPYDMQAVHAWLAVQDFPHWRTSRLDDLCNRFFSSHHQSFKGDVQVRELMQDQADLFFCRALAQHTWLRMAIEAHYRPDEAVRHFLLELDDTFRRVDKPVCYDFDLFFINKIRALSGGESLLLAGDWPTLRRKLFVEGGLGMDCSLSGDKLYKVQQILFRLSLLQSYALPLKRHGASSLAVYAIQASIVRAHVQSLVRLLNKTSLSSSVSQYLTPTYLESVRILTDLLARFVPPFLDKLFTFFDCWRADSVPGAGAYTQQDLTVLLRCLQEDLQIRSKTDESYHWLHFSYRVLPYYQKAKGFLSQVLDVFCAEEQQWLHRKAPVDASVETMMKFWQCVLFKKTRNQSETVVQLLERAGSAIRGSSTVIDVQQFWCKYASYWEFGLFNHTYFTARNTAPILVVGPGQQERVVSHHSMVRFFARVDGEEGAPSSSFYQDEVACLAVFKKLIP